MLRSRRLVRGLLFLSILSVVIPVVAQEEPVGVGTFVGRISLWAAIIIGLIASATTMIYAFQLRGGVVGTALSFISGGMLLVVLGFLAVVVSWSSPSIQALVHDILFIVGYILMLLGALRLRQMIR